MFPAGVDSDGNKSDEAAAAGRPPPPPLPLPPLLLDSRRQ